MRETKKYMCAAYHPDASTAGSSDMPPAPFSEPTCVDRPCHHGKAHKYGQTCWLRLCRNQKIGCQCIPLKGGCDG